MRPEIPEERVASRAGAQPEEASESAGDSRAAAEEILRESEERVAEASQSESPADPADEHRPSGP